MFLRSFMTTFSRSIKYISNAVRHRGGPDHPLNDLNSVDDIRNGLLLSSCLHRPLGDGESAFLKVCWSISG